MKQMKPIVLSAFLFVLSMATIATGDIRVMVKEKGMKDDFEQPDDQGKSELTLQLKNPSRNAKVVKELAGELDIYVPRNDSGAVSTIKDIVARGGKTPSEPSLKT